MAYVKVNNQFARSFDGIVKDILQEFPTAAAKSFREDVLHYPPANIIDKPGAYFVELSAPGFEKTDFNLRLDENVLTVSTEKNEPVIDANDKLIRKEFSNKSFKRSFTINDKIDAELISAKYENGILKLELPKKEISKNGPKAIEVL